MTAARSLPDRDQSRTTKPLVDDAVDPAPATPATPARRPYTPPVLKVYGRVDALTRTVGRVSTHADGGGGRMSKTH